MSTQTTAFALALALAAAPLGAQQPTPRDTGRAGATPAAPTGAATGVPTGVATGVPGAVPAARRDSTPPAITPAANQAAGVDAEIRMALFDLARGNDVPALTRLQWLSRAPMTLGDSLAAPASYRGREDMLFLLAESYYRLGIDSGFRAAAQPVVSAGSGRYTPLLRSQLLLDAYRRGDYQGALALAGAASPTDLHGLSSLVAGLAAYQLRDYPRAHAAFAAARGAGGTYGQYAQYMDALTTLRADTAQLQPALTALEALANGAGGEFGAQVRLTAAELAYEAGRYDDAVRLASGVPDSSGLAAQALLTRAWALYKADRVPEAGAAFAQFAARYPALPERDESRLMAGQTLLQLGKTQEAGQLFRTVADSATTEVRQLQARARDVMSQAARALVSARAAGLLFITDPESGKTIALQDRSDADQTVLAAAFADSTVAQPLVSASEIVAVDDVAHRLDGMSSSLGEAFPRRVLFAPASATRAPVQYAQAATALQSADADVAVARQRLQELLAGYRAELALLQQLSTNLGSDRANLDRMTAQLEATRNQLAQLSARLDAAAQQIRGMFRQQVDATRSLVAANQAALDSVRAEVGSGTGVEAGALATEAQTLAIYRAIADLIAQGMDNAISHHPTFALRDSVRARGDTVEQLLAQTRGALEATSRDVSAALARLQAGEPASVGAARTTLAALESRRAAAESQLVAVVNAELDARANEMIASLQRDTEAAQFGSASASFFQAIDANPAPGTQQTTGTTSSSSAAGYTGRPAASRTAGTAASSNPQK